MDKIISALNWRYATKGFDTNKKLTDEQLNYVLEAGRLSASSFGLQPWKFVVVTNPELKQKLFESAKQPQIKECSVLIVLCSLAKMTPEYVNKYVVDVANDKGLTLEMLQGFKDMLLGFIAGKNDSEMDSWMARQVYIALGTMLLACAAAEIDAGPMEGFNPAEFDKILGFEALGLKSKVLCALGFRSGKDDPSILKKSRFGKSEVVIEIK